MKTVGRFIRVAIGAVCVTFAVTFAVLVITEHKLEMLAGAAVFAVSAYFLLRPKKAKAAPALSPAPAQASSYAPDAPEETLREMRKYYGAEQAQNDSASCRKASSSFSRLQILTHSSAVTTSLPFQV